VGAQPFGTKHVRDVTENTENRPNDEFGVPWKDVLDAYFPELLAFFLPIAYDGIDWEREFLVFRQIVGCNEFKERTWLVNLKVVIHDAEEGGFWAEVPAIPGCATQGETLGELLSNLHEAITACLSVDVQEISMDGKSRVMEIAV